ncbi:PorZ beta-propeller-like domain-containing protein, partial [Streptococcus pyogenes]
MNKYTRILLCALYACFGALQAQTPMGKWCTHFSYNSVKQLTQSANKIFAVSDGALFSISKKDESIETYSKVNGLNGSNIVNL